jgi:hypothetical protein
MSAPVISNFNPATSVAIGPTDPISFDVVQGSNPFQDLWIAAKLAGTNLYEVIYDGAAFAPLYSAQSTIQNISGGYRFRLRRAGGWPGAPTVLAKVIDTAGGEAST